VEKFFRTGSKAGFSWSTRASFAYDCLPSTMPSTRVTWMPRYGNFIP